MDKLALTPDRLQYRYAIPDFLLQNFSHPYEYAGLTMHDLRKHSASLKSGNTPKPMETTPSPHQAMLNVVDFKAEDVSIEEWSLARTVVFTKIAYGGQGKTVSPDGRERREVVQQVEKMMSALEDIATRIITQIVASFDDLEDAVTITQSERDALRKYILILKYRSSTIQQHFLDDDSVGISESDTKKVPAYMKQKGFKNIYDVWFDNIKAMLEVEIDPDGNWLDSVKKNAYPDDAMWFFTHFQTI